MLAALLAPLSALALALPAQASGAAASGVPPDTPGSPPAVLELQGGVAIKNHVAASAGLDVETQPFISHFVGLRVGMSWVAQSSYHGDDLSQVGARLQVTAGWWRLEAAVGPILLQNSDAYNSGRLNVDSSVDFALTAHIRVRAEHWSNAQSRFPNEGRNLLLLDYRF